MYHLVLADDSQTIQKVVRLSFAGEDCAIHSFSTGQEALDYVKTAGADILLADTELPGLDGYDLCQELKSHSDTFQIPVILLCAAFVPLDRKRAEDVQYSSSISKPFEPNELVKLVKKHLSEPVPAQRIQEPENLTPSPVQDEDEIEFPSTFMSLPRPPVEGEILFSLTPEQCQPAFPVLKRRQKVTPEPLEQHAAEKQTEPGEVDQLVREVEERLKNSLRGIVSEVAREYLAPGERTQKADPNT